LLFGAPFSYAKENNHSEVTVLKISEVAAEKAKEILKAEGKEGWGLRIFIHGSGCCGPSYGMDIDEKAADGDQTVETNGLKVFCDNEAFASLSDKEMDFIRTEQGEGFVINSLGGAAPSCGSGCSGCED
jgi:iron-sulfur cluster assembly accessory protein